MSDPVSDQDFGGVMMAACVWMGLVAGLMMIVLVAINAVFGSQLDPKDMLLVAGAVAYLTTVVAAIKGMTR